MQYISSLKMLISWNKNIWFFFLNICLWDQTFSFWLYCVCNTNGIIIAKTLEQWNEVKTQNVRTLWKVKNYTVSKYFISWEDCWPWDLIYIWGKKRSSKFWLSALAGILMSEYWHKNIHICIQFLFKMQFIVYFEKDWLYITGKKMMPVCCY